MARVAARPVARRVRSAVAECVQIRVDRQRPRTVIAGTGESFVSPWPALLRRVKSGADVELLARLVPRDLWPRGVAPTDRLRLTADDRIEGPLR